MISYNRPHKKRRISVNFPLDFYTPENILIINRSNKDWVVSIGYNFVMDNQHNMTVRTLSPGEHCIGSLRLHQEVVIIDYDTTYTELKYTDQGNNPRNDYLVPVLEKIGDEDLRIRGLFREEVEDLQIDPTTITWIFSIEEKGSGDSLNNSAIDLDNRN